MAPQRVAASIAQRDLVIKAALPVFWLSSAYKGCWLLSALPCIAYVTIDGSTLDSGSARGFKTCLALALVAVEFLIASLFRSQSIVLHGWIAAVGLALLVKPG